MTPSADDDPVLWGLQHGFLPLLDLATTRALDAIGAALLPSTMLVGFPAGGEVRHPTLLQPEGSSRSFGPGDLTGCTASASRETCLAEALQAAPAGAGRSFFVGRPVAVDGYDVHPVLSVDSRRMRELARLEVDPAPVRPEEALSLPELVISELLRAASRALMDATTAALLRHRRGAADGLPREEPWIPEDVTAYVLRRAATRLVLAAETASGAVAANDLFETFEALAAMAYEGRPGAGGVVLAAREHPHVDVVVRLRRPVPVQDRRQLRKLLETTSPALDLLVDGASVYGLGAVAEKYDGASRDVFRFSVVDQGAWQMSHHGEVLLQVVNGSPLVARPRIPLPLFARRMRGVFSDVTPHDAKRIWHLAQAVAAQPHGALLVLSAAAEQEAERLAPEALVLEPRRVDGELLRALARIDGAVLLAPDGTCHAAGVILDGIATGTGDAGRGARYNSAVRYVTSSPAPCLAVIISEDGMIDLRSPLG